MEMQFADYELLLDLVGGGSATIAAGQTANIDYVVDADKMVTGAEYIAQPNWEDTISFQILDSSNNLIFQFATNMNIKDSGYYEFYRAKLETGLKVRVVYHNNGANDSKFKFNLVCHKDKFQG